MAVGIGAAGVVGIAVETTANTYLAPTKFFPIRSESLQWTQDTNMRRVIRGTVDPLSAVEGNGHVEGTLDIEVLTDVLPYLLQASRGGLVKGGVSPDFTYTFTANHVATPAETLSITIERNGVVFGYVGCVITGWSFSVDNGMAVATVNILGTAEASQAAPTETYANEEPFGSGTYNLQIPTATQVFDSDNFTLDIDDSGTPEMRLKDALGAQFISFGERTVNLSLDRDFESRAQFDAFKNLTAQSITLRLEQRDAAARYVEFVLPNTVLNTYDVTLGGPGELVRARATYEALHHAATGSSYTIEVGTGEDVTL